METGIECWAIPAIDLVKWSEKKSEKWSTFGPLIFFIFRYVEGGVRGNSNIGIKSAQQFSCTGCPVSVAFFKRISLQNNLYLKKWSTLGPLIFFIFRYVEEGSWVMTTLV